MNVLLDIQENEEEYPPYALVQFAEGLGFAKPKDTIWVRIVLQPEGERFRVLCLHKTSLNGQVLCEKVLTNDAEMYYMGQCKTCNKIFWRVA